MTREQEAIVYFKGEKKRLEDFRKIYPSPDIVGYQATTKEISFYDMAIRALSEELSEDGTLTVHVKDGSKVKRVFVMGDNIFGGLYYPDSAENKGELISRQAVNTLVDELARAISDERCFLSRGRSTGEIMSDILNLPPVENKDGWIPVTERLPEKNRAVLIYVDTGITKTYCLAYWNDRVKGWEEWIGYRMLETEMGYKVLAWQPLPEPYKKGE